MSTYFFRFPPLRLCAFSLFGGCTVVLGSGLWDALLARRGAVPLFDSAGVIKTEVSARYPCEVINGFDVVIRSFYVPVASDSGDQAQALSLSSRLRRFFDLFSNETHRVDSADLTVTAAEAQPVRVVVRDTMDTASGDGSKLIAASNWPPGTSKYSALILEPASRTGGSSGAPSSELPHSLLRQLADGATHQSLCRCNPRSTLLDMACESDPAYLGAPYLRVLLSSLLLLPSTLSLWNVAVLGIGGGSLPMFLQHYFAPRIHRCDLVDVEPMCIKAAVEQLGMKELLNAVTLEKEGGGVHYYVEDAVSYLSHRVGDTENRAKLPLRDDSGKLTGSEGVVVAPRHSSPVFHDVIQSNFAVSPATSTTRQRQLDLLLVDLFVGSELDSAVTSHEFLRLCRGALSPHGVVAFNLPVADRRFVQLCKEIFGTHNVYRIPVPASSNEVVLARGGPQCNVALAEASRLSHRHMFRRAKELTAQYRLPYDLANHYPLWWRLW